MDGVAVDWGLTWGCERSRLSDDAAGLRIEFKWGGLLLSRSPAFGRRRGGGSLSTGLEGARMCWRFQTRPTSFERGAHG